jgi:hypothetical protein
LLIPARGLKVRKWSEVASVPFTLAFRLCVLASDGLVSPTVMVTVVLLAPITTVGSIVGLDVPPVVPLEVMVMYSLSMVEGTPQVLSNVTMSCPEPATTTLAVVKAICICPVAPAAREDSVMSSMSTSALAFEGEKKPKASMVAIIPIAINMASPKEVPILVFIYSFLLILEVGLREVFINLKYGPNFGLPSVNTLRTTGPHLLKRNIVTCITPARTWG